MKKITAVVTVMFCVLLMFTGCSDDISHESAVIDTKEMVFDNFGTAKMKEVADKALEDVKWTCEGTPDYEDGTIYTVSLSVTDRLDNSEVLINFKVKYEYRNNNESLINYSIWVDSISIDGELHEEQEVIEQVMEYLYSCV